MLDSGASKTFVNSRRGLQLTGRSDKVVETKLQATNTGLLSTRALSKGAREAIVVPGMSQPALMSVSTLANSGYTTVFLPGNDGVDVYCANNVVISSTAPPALQGWRDGRGMWMVLVVNDNQISPGLDVAETAMGVYGLPSTKEVVRFLHAALEKSHTSYATYRGPARQPRHISRHDTPKYLATLSRIRRDSKGSHEADEARCQINEDSGRRCNAWRQALARRKTQRCVPYSSMPPRNQCSPIKRENFPSRQLAETNISWLRLS